MSGNCPECGGRGCRRCTRIEFQTQEALSYNQELVREFLEALKEVSGIEACFVSDSTMPCDFCLEPEDMTKLNEKLGIECSDTDTLDVILKKMRNR